MKYVCTIMLLYIVYLEIDIAKKYVAMESLTKTCNKTASMVLDIQMHHDKENKVREKLLLCEQNKYILLRNHRMCMANLRPDDRVKLAKMSTAQ